MYICIRKCVSIFVETDISVFSSENYIITIKQFLLNLRLY